MVIKGLKSTFSAEICPQSPACGAGVRGALGWMGWSQDSLTAPGTSVPGLPLAWRHCGRDVGNNLPTKIEAGNLEIKISQMISGLLKA